MIVKVQKPLDPGPVDVLVYDKSRRFSLFMQPDNLPDEVMASLTPYPKAYWRCRFVGDGLEFVSQAPDQPW